MWFSPSGQSTVEYLIVFSAFMAMVVVVGALWHVGRDGTLVRLATQAASHGSGNGMIAQIKDVLVF